MSVPGDGALRSGPAKHRQRPRWPSFVAVRAGIDLISQVQETQVPKRLRSKTADLDVVFHDRPRLTARVGDRGKKLLLMVESRSPRQHAADVQPFALDLAEHDRGVHTFRRERVVRTAGGVDMVIAAEESVCGRIDPPFETD